MFKRFLHGSSILSSRRFIKLTGLDAPKFLQGLTTNDIEKLGTSGQYSALLNAQGRMMYDIFIYRVKEDYFIECDGQIQERVFLHLQTYNLRTKTDIKMVQEPVVVFSSVQLQGAMASAKDIRSNWNFTRYLFPSKSDMEASLSSNAPTFSEARYNRERILRGIPEGAYEIASRQAIPLEYNVDLMGGIDFNKGCYLGQELVTRTHHRGLVRKRVLPLRFHALDPETVKPLRNDPFECHTQSLLTKNLDKQNEFLPTSIDSSGKLKILSRTDCVGKHIFGQGNIGIGMMRLESLKEPESRLNLATLDHVDSNWILADALIPEWWPETIFDNLTRQ
jgi:transferase CAF17, mitochondrial